MNLRHPSIGVVALVTHARTVPSEARERFAEAAASLADDPRVMILRTCHRAELYAVVDDPDACPRSLALPELPAGGRRLTDHEAIRHLFTVAAGHDSIVVGEDQVLHQLRDCLIERRLAASVTSDASDRDGSIPEVASGVGVASGDLEPALERLFQLALHVGRQSRAWREGPPRSLADVALDRIEAEVGSLDGRALLVVGAGSMGRLTALAAGRRRARVVVSNRSTDRAATLAGDVDGASIPFGAVGPLDLAGVIVAISGRWELDEEATASLAALRPPVIDLSSPPALAPALRELLGSRFVSVDDLARGPEDRVRDRVRRRIERLLDEADAEFTNWVGARRSVPAIQALTERAETRRAAEVDRLLRRMPHLEAHERELVEQMSHRLVAGLLHAPLATLREDQGGERERAARELFSL
jgi:glutamyl-tRNA reductase